MNFTFEGDKPGRDVGFTSRQCGVNKVYIYEYRQQSAGTRRIPKVIDG